MENSDAQWENLFAQVVLVRFWVCWPGLPWRAVTLEAAEIAVRCPTMGRFRAALKNAVGAGGNGGLGFNMWGTIVDNSGIVCAVAFSGTDFTRNGSGAG